MKKVTSIKFGVRLDELTDEQLTCLYEKNKLWNALVEIDRYNREQYNNLIDSHKEVAPLVDEEESLKACLAILYEDKKKTRSSTKGNKQDKEFDDKIKPLKIELAELYKKLKKIKLKARKELKKELDIISTEHFEYVKKAKQCTPLWHPNTADVGFIRYPASRSKAMKEGTLLRYKHFDRTGNFYLSFPKVTETNFEKITSGLCPQFHVTCAKTKYNRFKFAYDRIDKDYKYITGSIALHREVPEDYMIKEAKVSVKKISGKIKAYLVMTLINEEADEFWSGSNMACGINFGFRDEGDKGIRVATLVGQDQGEINILRLDRSFVDSMHYANDLQSKLEKSLNEMIPKFKSINFEQAPDEVKDFAERLIKAPKFAGTTFTKLLLTWKLSGWNKEDYWDFESFRSNYNRRNNESISLKTKNLNRRKDQYRKWVKDVCAKYAIIGIDNTDFKEIARVKDSSGAKETKLLNRSRSNRFLVAVSELRNIIETTSIREGCTLTKHKDFNATCSYCALKKSLSFEKGTWNAVCAKCDTHHDVDENASKNILSLAKAAFKE